MSSQYRLFATAPKGMEGLLADELRQLGAANVAETRAGVGFQGDLSTAYRVCLWSRIANRVLLPVAHFPAADPEQLYQGVLEIDWQEHLAVDGSLAVDFTSVGSEITHTQYGAQKVKDAIVDQFRHDTGERPSVDRDCPDVRINVFLYKDQATVNIDLSGDSLHRRGYRLGGGGAPLKENLAAGILMRANWPTIAQAGGALVDPMCGSGTLLIEAALMAADSAPGLQRSYWGFTGWKGHDADCWSALLAVARKRRVSGLAKMGITNKGLESENLTKQDSSSEGSSKEDVQKRPIIYGYDVSATAIEVALDNVTHAGLEDYIEITQRSIKDCAPAPEPIPGSTASGLVVVNPPYGERLGEYEELKSLYKDLGDCLKANYTGWRASVITSDAELGKCIGIRARHINTLFNGALECKLLRFELDEKWFMKQRGDLVDEPGAKMFANRLRKNLKQLRRWARQENISCFRAYDADMPEYAFAIDVYETEASAQSHQDAALWIVVQEYAAPASIEPRKVKFRRDQVMAVLPQVFEVPETQVVLKTRERQRGNRQYEKQDVTREFHEVREGPCRLWVNFHDYLDTGLFLDHRRTRQLLGEWATGGKFLNLFAYTGVATVHAALGVSKEGDGQNKWKIRNGAVSTTTVDMSRTYLDIARRNLTLNGIQGDQHEIVQEDCLLWIDKALILGKRYDLIFLDPPTFSNSKRMDDSFDIQRDHVELVQKTAALLAPGGLLVFSNNFRRFKLDEEGLSGLLVEEISSLTLPKDFARNPKIHRCWKIRQEKKG
ncbi:MAG: bifunctional 23S rRNA (guanine(2069)-N(7))-methyltransferase RlmK/23S rRNA (guanine(2445)-N(2))-methyltransferase RlmL [Ectothiorhodospiraceae bacterium]|nr:bifunctional 23S rRNA (guanine(2069)-N(7))-methyltransferase RlmK/23S rRNA (guanine(2445)-N(2))-methyltransferase RlmL [Ectothiorhodospiraceae bacterium]